MKIQSYSCNGIRFSVKWLPNCEWPYIWRAPKATSGRCYPTIRAARKAAEAYLTKFGDVPAYPPYDPEQEGK